MLKLFAVYDDKAAAFGAVMCLPTNGLALRAFADACADARSPMAQYPMDYKLMELGEYDPNSGSIKGLPLPLLVATASQVLQQLSVARGATADLLKEVRS